MRPFRSDAKSSTSWVVARLGLFLVCMTLRPVGVSCPGTLIVGNSMVYFNEGADVFSALDGDRAVVDSVTGSGFLLRAHVRHWRAPASVLRRHLHVRGRYDRVVLQEGGFALFNTDLKEDSFRSLLFLGEQVRATGAEVVLYEQAVRQPHESCETYFARQSIAWTRYVDLARALRMRGHVVRVAPAGEAYRRIASEQRAGDPCAEGAPLDALFDPDDHHPSLRGTYLAMVVIAATARSLDPRGFADAPALGPNTSRFLREVAYRTLQDPCLAREARGQSCAP